MDSYHGTSPSVINNLVNGKIDVSLGGGELGIGFYTGQHLFEAKAWANNKFVRSKSVLCINIPDKEIDKLEYDILDYNRAYNLRKKIKKLKMTRNYIVNIDFL